MNRTGPRPYLGGPISIALKHFFPLSSSPIYRSYLQSFFRKRLSNRPSTVVAVMNHRQPPMPAKRKNQRQRSAHNKRQRTDTLVAPQGTQDDSFEIGSSPAPEPAAQRVSTPRLQLPVKEWGLRVQPHAKPPGKFWAVIGHVPGIYGEPYGDILEGQLKGCPGSQPKRCKTVEEAWAWLEQNKVGVNEVLNRPKGHTYLASIGKASNSTPQRGQYSSSTQEISNLSQPRAGQTATTPRHASSSFPGLHARHSKALLLGCSVSSGKDDLPRTTENASQHPSASSSTSQSPTQHDTATETEITLDPDQQTVVERIKENHNVFYTGPAGCGKSAILKVFKEQLEDQGKQVFVIAPTNLAALAVGGRTTYTYAGWPVNVGKFSLKWLEDSCVDDDGIDSAAAVQFKNTDVLVFDEISMIENNFFERLSRIMKAARKSKEAFGGVQIIVTGDFCQLPPVEPFKHCFRCGGELERDRDWNPTKYTCNNKFCAETEFLDRHKYAFHSKAWDECNFKHVNLTKIHRQADEKFISILQRIRLEGEITPEDRRLLLDHYSETTDAVEIFPKRENVGEINRQRIERLPGESIRYKCKDYWLLKKHHKGNPSFQGFGSRRPSGDLWKLDKHRYETDLELKKNMRIVLLHNLAPQAGLVNGSQGKIIDFEAFDEIILPRKRHGLDGAHAEYAEHQIADFCDENEVGGRKSPWPVVAFDNGVIKTLYPHCSETEYGSPKPYSLLSRTQIPIMAGYAMTIHKAQGMSLDKVIVDLSKAFDPEQQYVALSRARTLKGLKVNGLPLRPLPRPSEDVLKFLESFS